MNSINIKDNNQIKKYNYLQKYKIYKNKYLTLKSKIINQSGGVDPNETLETNIQNYTAMLQFDEDGLISENLNILIAIRNCNNMDNLSMLAVNSNNDAIKYLIQQKINTLNSDGDCNTIGPNGEIINLDATAHVGHVSSTGQSNSSTSVSTYQPERNSDGVVIPQQMPGTQSAFYMPLISEAYYIARGQAVPQYILNQSAIVTGLPGISIERYNNMVQVLVNYLQIDGNLVRLQAQYQADRSPSDNNVGHISGNNQENLLGAVNLGDMSLQLILEQAIGLHYAGI